MRIFEIGTGYTPIPAQVAAATESIVEELTNAFIKLNQPVEILDISANDRAKNSLPISEVMVPSFFTKSDVSLGIVHKLKRVVYSVALSFKLKKLLKKQTEKVVLHFHNQYNLFFFTKLVSKKIRSKALIAYTNHNGYWALPWNEVKDILHKRYFQEIVAMQNADAVFVLNNNTMKNVVEHINVSREKVTVINNGVNTDVYYPLSNENKEDVKRKFNLSGKKIILQVGSVNENKGQDRAIRILSSVLRENSDLIYCFAGGIVSQEYFELVNQTAIELGVDDKVIYLGAFAPGEEMNRIYNIADATVFNSIFEGFPLVCLESLSTATPVMLLYKNDLNLGGGCVKCDEKNINDFIFEFIINKNDKFSDLCMQARENAVNSFAWNSIAQNYLKEFN